MKRIMKFEHDLYCAPALLMIKVMTEDEEKNLHWMLYQLEQAGGDFGGEIYLGEMEGKHSETMITTVDINHYMAFFDDVDGKMEALIVELEPEYGFIGNFNLIEYIQDAVEEI